MELSIASLSNELASLVEKTSPSVVAIDGRRRMHSSGIHWRPGLVVIAEHALRRDEDISVKGADGNEAGAVVLGRDPTTDLALLKVEGLRVPTIDDKTAEDARVGDVVLVIGRSPNSGPNASMGIISAVSGAWRTWRGGELDKYSRLDASVFPGSSGGAVIDHRGQFIGLATSALSRVAGLAIPVSTVRSVCRLLEEKGAIPRGFIGVGLQTVPIPESFQKTLSLENAAGIMVLNVEPGGPADKGGILIGDILFEIEKQRVESVEDVQAALEFKNIGKRVHIKLIRGGAAREQEVVIGERNQRGTQ